jgi:hypothetical protein
MSTAVEKPDFRWWFKFYRLNGNGLLKSAYKAYLSQGKSRVRLSPKHWR